MSDLFQQKEILKNLVIKRNIPLLLILLLGAFLRIYHLDYQSIWFDEASAIMVEGKNPFTVWTNQVSYPNPPLYFTLLHYWMFCFGKSLFATRAFSALISILSILFIYYAGKVIFDKKVGLYAAFLLSISPLHIYYSQETRMYALSFLLSVGSFLFFYLALKKNNFSSWLGFTIFTILGLYTHNYLVFILLAEVIFFAYFYIIYRLYLLKFLLSQLFIFICFLPRIIVFPKQITMRLNPWILQPHLQDLSKTLFHFMLLSYKLPLTNIVKSSLINGVPIFMYLFFMAFVVNKNTQMRNFLREREIGFYIFLILFISIFVPWLISFIIIPIYVSGRYEIVALPSFLLIVAWGLTKIKRKSLHHSLLSFIIIMTLFCLLTYYFEFKKSNGHLIIEYVKSQVDKQDILVFTNLSLPVFRYYCEQENLSYVYFPFPEASPGGSLTKEALIGEPVYANFEIEKFKRKVFPLLKKNKLWIFCSQRVKIDNMFTEELNKNLRFIKKIDLPEVDLPSSLNRIYIYAIGKSD